jgi:hypothetical protein
MSRIVSLASIILAAGLAAGSVGAQDEARIRSQEAKNHAGEFVEVCGVIADANYARRSRGSPTYLNFDQPYPEHEFTAIVWGKDRREFPFQPEDLEGYRACVYGKVEMYRGKAQIVLVRPEQIAAVPPKDEDQDGDAPD